MITCPHCNTEILYTEYIFYVKQITPSGITANYELVHKDVHSAEQAMEEVYKLKERFPGGTITWIARNV